MHLPQVNSARNVAFGQQLLRRRKEYLEVALPPQQGASTMIKRGEQKGGHAGPEQAREGVCRERLGHDWTTPRGLVGSLTSCQTGQSQPGVGDASPSQGQGNAAACGRVSGPSEHLVNRSKDETCIGFL